MSLRCIFIYIVVWFVIQIAPVTLTQFQRIYLKDNSDTSCVNFALLWRIPPVRNIWSSCALSVSNSLFTNHWRVTNTSHSDLYRTYWQILTDNRLRNMNFPLFSAFSCGLVCTESLAPPLRLPTVLRSVGRYFNYTSYKVCQQGTKFEMNKQTRQRSSQWSVMDPVKDERASEHAANLLGSGQRSKRTHHTNKTMSRYVKILVGVRKSQRVTLVYWHYCTVG